MVSTSIIYAIQIIVQMTKDSSKVEWPLVFPGWQGYVDIIAEATICCLAMNLHTISNQFENPALV